MSTPRPDHSPGAAIGSMVGRGHDARRALAAAGEQFAVEHLERLGYAILARNHRTRLGELDVVARDRASLVFVEVKTRRDGRDVDPWMALHEGKRLRVRRMAIAYLAEADVGRRGPVRFDAIAVVIDPRGGLVSLEHREGAF